MLSRFRLALASLWLVQFAGCAADDPMKRTPAGSSGAANGGAGGSGVGGAQAGSSSGGSAGSTGGSGGIGTIGSGGTSGSSTGGAAGTAGSAGVTPMPVTPTESNGTYTFSYGDIVFAVSATTGGRIVTFSKAGTDILDHDDANNYGSTFWPSPQSVWGWPPPAEIDNTAYTAALDGASLVLTGTKNAALNLSCSKRFSVDSALDRVDIEYTLKNEGTANTNVAPWEVTRVDAAGLTFFPAPTDASKVESQFKYEWDAATHVTWWDYATATPHVANEKLFQDGSGWLAHTVGTRLFVKTFPDVGYIAPDAPAAGEAEVEVYGNGSTYVELENQGAYVTLAAGTTLTYAVRWYLRDIPGTVTVASGDTSLYDFAQSIAQEP